MGACFGGEVVLGGAVVIGGGWCLRSTGAGVRLSLGEREDDWIGLDWIRGAERAWMTTGLT